MNRRQLTAQKLKFRDKLLKYLVHVQAGLMNYSGGVQRVTGNAWLEAGIFNKNYEFIYFPKNVDVFGRIFYGKYSSKQWRQRSQ